MAGINEIAKQAGLKEEQARAVFSAVATLAADESVIVRGFGSFKTVTRKARTARNPKTGEEVLVPEKIQLSFKAAKAK